MNRPVNQDAPEVGQTSETYNYDAVDLCSALRAHGNYTVGVLLTAVEAALGDSKQSEALKAIVRREMFALIDRNQGEVYERFKMQEPGLTPKEIRIDGQDEDVHMKRTVE